MKQKPGEYAFPPASVFFSSLTAFFLVFRSAVKIAAVHRLIAKSFFVRFGQISQVVLKCFFYLLSKFH